MEEEGKKTPEEGAESTTLEDALTEIARLKKETVPREKYDEEREYNRKLLDQIVNGSFDGNSGTPEPKTKPDLAKLAKEVTRGHRTNVEYARAVLAYRDAMIEQGKGDPFLPLGERAERDDKDAEKAQRVADALRYAVERADEAKNPEVFTDTMQYIMRDPPGINAIMAARRAK